MRATSWSWSSGGDLQGIGAQGFHQPPNPFLSLGAGPFRGRQDPDGVLQEARVGVFHPSPLASRHGVASEEMGQGALKGPHHLGFHAPHVGPQAIGVG